ncbi:hypothetical protein MGYG_02554 [Nannizzia gypsea CBS 118893]|uniref:Uncharacterized protein n=1 Tax=Arthroderma gypseum (strain ATCC MYA-4604 / CBS 118893) TaxID=535722 RepID=E4UN80_ARTGP|nr:hypothetical protein MGYG_02554 [Nannizzia gypsea CBS 118893]EFQ99541.1 hypothetical protein MGYG_02554 [Nannizzia gypsea CBS 118893]
MVRRAAPRRFDREAACFPNMPFPPDFVKEMVEKHSRLIPRALKKIDKQLLEAGISQEEVDRLSKGRDGGKKEAYAKLDRLVDAKRTMPPEEREYRVLFGKRDGEWLSQELAVDAGCTLVEFDNLARQYEYGLARWVSNRADSMAGDDDKHGSNGSLNESQWFYKLVPANESVVEQTEEGWKRLETAEHFESLKERQIQGRTRTVLMCHEETMRNLVLVTDPVPEPKLEPYRILFGPRSGEIEEDQEQIFRIEAEADVWAAAHGFEGADPSTTMAMLYPLPN